MMAARPRQQNHPWQPREIIAYDLDARSLHWMQREWLAHYIMRRTGLSHADALHLVDSWPIEASDCVVIEETAVSVSTAVSAFVRSVRIAIWPDSAIVDGSRGGICLISH